MEFQRYASYHRAVGLPTRRIELMLAQLSAVVAQALGGSSATWSDFVLDESVQDAAPADDDGEPFDVESAQAAFGFRPTLRRSPDGQ